MDKARQIGDFIRKKHLIGDRYSAGNPKIVFKEIDDLIQTGKIEEAKKHLEADDAVRKFYTRVRLAEYFLKQNQKQQASEILESAERDIVEIKDNFHFVEDLLSSFAALGDAGRVRTLVEVGASESARLKEIFYCKAGEAFLERGDSDQAFQFMTRADWDCQMGTLPQLGVQFHKHNKTLSQEQMQYLESNLRRLRDTSGIPLKIGSGG